MRLLSRESLKGLERRRAGCNGIFGASPWRGVLVIAARRFGVDRRVARCNDIRRLCRKKFGFSSRQACLGKARALPPLMSTIYAAAFPALINEPPGGACGSTAVTPGP